MDKWLDVLMDNRSFMKLVALVMALLLFGSIYDSNNQTNDINIPGEEETVTIEDIPVKSYYDTDNLVVSGVPETVKVTMKGPKPNLQAAKAQRDFEVYVDLSKAKVGKQRVKLKIKDLSDKLTTTIDPEYVSVTIQEKVTKEFNVEVEFNKELVAEGYEAGTPVVKPNKVKITGGKSDIEKISYVKAIVETNGELSSTLEQSAPVIALDENYKKLNVAVEQETVRITVPIKLANKKVPIEIVEKGSPPEGVTIDSITLDTKEAKISGSEDVLVAIENVRVEVDVSTISENTEMTLPIIISEGIKEVEPKMVKATVKVTLASEEAITTNVSVAKTFSDLPISITGLSERLSVTFHDPPDGKISLTAKGTNEVIGNLKETDFQLSLNLADLKEGEQEVKINVTGPENINWSLANDSARITITAKES